MASKQAVKSSPFLAVALLVAILCAAPSLAAENLFIAAAANFIRPLEELAKMYREEQGVRTTLSFGSSGKLYAQILQGAPYDIFLSADKERPFLLYGKGLCEPPFQYSAGQVVLWSRYHHSADSSWQDIISEQVGKIAISNPETAPYGKVPRQTLHQLKLLKELQPYLVYGQSVGQTFLFAQSGAAEFGFIALSQALSQEGQKGQYWPIPESPPIEQWGCVIVHAKNQNLSQNFQSYLTEEPAQNIIRRHGYL